MKKLEFIISLVTVPFEVTEEVIRKWWKKFKKL